MAIRLATFNVENLFSRFDFSGRYLREQTLVGTYKFEQRDQFELAHMVFSAVHADDMRQMTALALAEADADIVCVQEVDNEEALNVFYENYLKPVLHQRFAAGTKGLDGAARHSHSHRYFYDWRHILPGNDRRGIDVGVLSRREIGLRSHASFGYNLIRDAGIDWAALEALGESMDKPVFRRDCLELDVDVDGAPLTIFNCHFKSRGGAPVDENGVSNTAPIRHAEATAVRHIIESRFGKRTADANWVICGDLNDYAEVDGEPVNGHGLAPLLEDGFAVNPVWQLPAKERWTHYHPGRDMHVQLDYILLSPALARANRDAKPEILRHGQPYRVPRVPHEGRYPRVGWDRPKASDHCPVVIELEIPRR